MNNIELSFTKEELLKILKDLPKTNSSYYKLESSYMRLFHVENGEKLLKEFYGINFFSAIYVYSKKDYEDNLLKFDVKYMTLNPETFESQINNETHYIEIEKDGKNCQYYMLELD